MKLILTYSIIFVLAAFTSCLKPEQFPVEPAIEFSSFTQFGDSAELVVSFTDGDGNIGLSKSDTTGGFSSTQRYHHNLFVEYFEKVDGAGWQPGKDLNGDDIIFKYRIPVLTPQGKNKALKGKIRVTIEPSFYNPISPDSDTLKYRITLVDRDFNESNAVESIEVTR